MRRQPGNRRAILRAKLVARASRKTTFRKLLSWAKGRCDVTPPLTWAGGRCVGKRLASETWARRQPTQKLSVATITFTTLNREPHPSALSARALRVTAPQPRAGSRGRAGAGRVAARPRWARRASSSTAASTRSAPSRSAPARSRRAERTRRRPAHRASGRTRRRRLGRRARAAARRLHGGDTAQKRAPRRMQAARDARAAVRGRRAELGLVGDGARVRARVGVGVRVRVRVVVRARVTCRGSPPGSNRSLSTFPDAAAYLSEKCPPS